MPLSYFEFKRLSSEKERSNVVYMIEKQTVELPRGIGKVLYMYHSTKELDNNNNTYISYSRLTIGELNWSLQITSYHSG